MNKILPKIIAVVGPTGSGKTALGINLAKKFNGEVISLDSRQIYKEMNIGTAKIGGIWQKDSMGLDFLDVEGVPHYGIDLITPDQIYSVAEFKEYAVKIIENILQRGHLPILVGGTGLYFKAIIENLTIPKIAADDELRASLENKSLEELAEELKKVDKESYKIIDLKNKRRIVRALEVFYLSGQGFSTQQTKGDRLFNVLKLGLNVEREKLYERLDKRVEEQFEQGLIDETKSLIKMGYNDNLPSMTGIGYKEVGMYLKEEISMDKAKELIKFRTHDYVRRQETWFKKDSEIKWIEPNEAEELVRKFLA